MVNKYIDLMSEFFPTTECYSIGPNYSDLVYVSGSPIPGIAVLDTKYIQRLKDTRILRCNKEANDIQKYAQHIVIGTDNIVQTKVYEQKFRKAYTYMQAINAGAIPAPAIPDIVLNEVAETGEDPAIVINRILSNGQLTWNQLDPILGQIEGLRRKYAQDIKASANNEVSIMAIPWPIWPDIDNIISTQQASFVQ